MDNNPGIIARILEGSGFPSLSPLAVRLVELASDEQASASDLAKIITNSPGLTTRLLSLANSPAFLQGGGEITSVERAVVLLGMREVRIMALSFSMRDTLPIKRGGPDYELFWRASLYRAVLARETAMRLGIDLPEEAFVAGLIQEMGLTALLRVLKPFEMEGFPGLGASLESQLAWEKERLGVDHRRLGAKIMTRWGLPRDLVACQTVVPQDVGRDEASHLPGVADFARRATEAFFLPEGVITDIYSLAWRRFGLGEEAVSQVLAKALAYVGQTAQSLDIDLDGEADLLEVMEKANAALTRLTRGFSDQLHKVAGPWDAEEKNSSRETVKDTLDAVVHEIRNPLMSVGGFARRLAEQIGQEGKAAKYAEVIITEAARLDQALAAMSGLVEEFTPNLASLDLVELLQRTQDEQRRPDPARPQSHPLEIQWHIPRNPLMVNADSQGLERAVSLLLAYAASLAGRRVPLEVYLGDKQGTALILITGDGQLPRSGGSPFKDKTFGAELGLKNARRLVEAMGGRLSLSQGPKGKGIAISVALPLAK